MTGLAVKQLIVIFVKIWFWTWKYGQWSEERWRTDHPLGPEPDFDVRGVAEVSNDCQAAQTEIKHLEAEERQNISWAVL